MYVCMWVNKVKSDLYLQYGSCDGDAVHIQGRPSIENFLYVCMYVCMEV